MNKIILLIIFIILLVVLIFGFLAWRGYQLSKERELLVATDRKEYQVGENPKVKIENNSAKMVCFSSCYPYYLEKDGGSPQAYRYSTCPHPDTVETCMEGKAVKAFELLLDKMKVEKGSHRVAIPACIGCALKENFRRDKFFYSNEFTIK